VEGPVFTAFERLAVSATAAEAPERLRDLMADRKGKKLLL
jgi:hypothetical protein